MGTSEEEMGRSGVMYFLDWETRMGETPLMLASILALPTLLADLLKVKGDGLSYVY